MEEQNNILIDNTEPLEVLLIGLTNKSNNNKIAVTEELYNNLAKEDYNVDGIIIRDEDRDLNILYSLLEVEATAGEGSEDIPETDKRRKNYINPIFDEYKGEEETEQQYLDHEDVHKSGCAICEAKKFGFLPSCGEMLVLFKNKETFNTLAESINATLLSDSNYWTSTLYNFEHVWSLDMESGIFQFWKAKATTMKVRPAKNASEYITEDNSE